MKQLARKRFGQHFLRDRSVIEAIVAAIDPKPGDALVEIGPGHGALTAPLLERSHALSVIELDRDLVARLRGMNGLEVIQGDVLSVDFALLASRLCHQGTKLSVCGNLPYNISTPLLFHLMPWASVIAQQVFMLQQEVVDRMTAGTHSSAYGRLSVMLGWRYQMEQILEVGPQAFEPPPKVLSAVVRMLPLAHPPIVDEQILSQLVRTAFSQRRKLLRHTLGPFLQERGFGGQFDLQRRAQEVSVSEYVALAQAL